MTNLKMLRKTINDSGMRLNFLAGKMGMCRQTFWNRMAGKSEFTLSEIEALTKVLRLTKSERDEIFFNSTH